MNTIHRIGLAVAGIATMLAVAGALVVDGYLGAMSAQAQASNSASAAPTDSPTDTPTDTPSLAPVTVYVIPAPTPTVQIVNSYPAAPVVVAEPPAPPAAPTPTPRPAPRATPRPIGQPTAQPTDGPQPTFGNGGDD
jgi:hypothetical protein